MKTHFWFVLPWDINQAGGVNQVVLNLNKQFRERDINTAVLVQNWNDIDFRETNSSGLKIFHSRLRDPLSGSLKAKLMYWLMLPANLLKLAKILAVHQVKHLNFHFPTSSCLTFIFLKKLGLYSGKLILSFHGSDVSYIASTTGLEAKAWLFILSNADNLVACSQSLANRIIHKFPVLSSHIRVIHNGFDPKAFAAERNPNACLPNDLVNSEFFLNIGSFDRVKGQDILLQAFRQVADLYPDLKLALIGRVTGKVITELQTMAKAFGLESRIVFIKNLPHADLGPFMENAKAFILSSRLESFGIVILEAGAFALPVIASRVGGIPEILNSPALGILVEPVDPAALSLAMQQVLNDSIAAKKMGKNLQRQVISNFDWDRAVDDYINLLDPP